MRRSPLPPRAAPSPRATRDDDDVVADHAAEDGGTASREAAAASPSSSIVVAVRKRPAMSTEVVLPDEANFIQVDSSRGSVSVRDQKVSLDRLRVVDQTVAFSFDCAFDERASNALVYMNTARPLLDAVRKGRHALVFAFGQTGSGKTHTMMGNLATGDHGLCALAARDMLATFKGMKLSTSFYEIYGSKVFDLLNDRHRVKMLEDANHDVQLLGLTEHALADHEGLLDLMRSGLLLRASGETHANSRSSRSHAVLVINVRTRRDPQLFSRMIFIDLAGSERAADTMNLDKGTRLEGAEINRSLLALKECVRAMQRGKKHVPFRGSKLTQVLRDSFIGQCSTCMIANISPLMTHMEDTVNTLRYADRIKELQPGDANRMDGAGESSVEPDLCPKCGFPFFVDNPALHVCPKVYVVCPHCKLDVAKHNLANHVDTCLDAPVTCMLCCLRGLRRSELAAHQAHTCPKARVHCSHCHEAIGREDLGRHIARTCPMVRTQCLQCRESFPRGILAEHESVECPMRQVVCPTCGFMMRWNKFAAHAAVCAARRTSLSFHVRGPLLSGSVPRAADDGPLTDRRSKPSLKGIRVKIEPSAVARLPSLSGTIRPRSSGGTSASSARARQTPTTGVSAASSGQRPTSTGQAAAPPLAGSSDAADASSNLGTPSKRKSKKHSRVPPAAPPPPAGDPFARSVSESIAVMLTTRATGAVDDVMPGGNATLPPAATSRAVDYDGVATTSPPADDGVATTSPPAADGVATTSPPAADGVAAATPKKKPAAVKNSSKRVRPVPRIASGDVPMAVTAVTTASASFGPTCGTDDAAVVDSASGAPAVETAAVFIEELAADVSCPFAVHGCAFSTRTVSALHAHLATSTDAHATLLQSVTAALERENSRLRRRVSELERHSPVVTPSARPASQPPTHRSAPLAAPSSTNANVSLIASPARAVPPVALFSPGRPAPANRTARAPPPPSHATNAQPTGASLRATQAVGLVQAAVADKHVARRQAAGGTSAAHPPT